MNDYNHLKIEAKWQKFWEEQGLFRAEDNSKKEKWYTLVEFPYPSAAGLHVGHARSYVALDVLSRKKRMDIDDKGEKKYNVMYPFGWDAFGLPAENYAIKYKIHPRQATEESILNFTQQIKTLGISFDWSREINTTDPAYYKWTQWIFLQLLKHDLAYKHKMSINWCPSCKIGLANEEVVNGKCERCGAAAEKKEKEQWMLRITKYADRLIDDLETVDFLDKIKSQQINWIGRSEGAEVDFDINGEAVTVFTTRPDTLFGATYFVLSPEHDLVQKITTPEQKEAVDNYVREARSKSDLERTELQKEKTGVFTGASVINPVNGEKIPVWIADYVLTGYGTGAIMAVPAHDERDFAFAQKYGLEIREVVKGEEGGDECFSGEGISINSDFLNGLNTVEAKKKIIKWLEEKKLGKKAINYKLRDWVFSRQRYWGEPIPVVHCEKCGIVPLEEKDLPLELPDVENYEPTDTGESPLAAMTDWVNTSCPKCGGQAKRETDTMPNWAGSSWYFLRYCDQNNDQALADKNKLKYWLPVSLYNGGMEHTTLHLLYSRFWNKFLFDIGVVPVSEPYQKRISHGMVLADDGKKMSKSLGNVVNPNDVVAEHGADTLRLYEMFMGPFADTIPWNEKGLVGVRKFLEKVNHLSDRVGEGNLDRQTAGLLHKTIKKVGEDIDSFHFNTAVSQLMILNNELSTLEVVPSQVLKTFVTILAPFAPHLAEELWQKLGGQGSVCIQDWPQYDEELIRDEKVELVVQINGKVRDRLELEAGLDQAAVEELIKDREKVKQWLEGKETVKVIFVPDKLINIVVK